QKQNYMDNINMNPSEIALVQDNDLKPIWDDIYFGLVYSLSIYEYAHKPILALSQCVANGYWSNWEEAKKLMTCIIKRKPLIKHSKKTDIFEYKIWPDNTEK